MADVITNTLIYFAYFFGGTEAAAVILLVIIGVWAALNRASLPTIVFVFFLLLGSMVYLSNYLLIAYGVSILLSSAILFFGLRAQQSGA